jgi:hypothetical protein
MEMIGICTCYSFDGERAIYATCTAVWYMVIGRIVQVLRATKEAREKTAGLSRLSNSLPRSESLCVFSIME